ncbi:MAG: branched-chain amino acid transport system ATP-binding protein, partial [Candidatus Eremiobacteraeota bacterium]|nr:branched-chain amino acid transport system ATP-binding protein [Candidatus Eremiobacteraeota bacterium]
FGGVLAVDGVSFDVPAGTLTALIGPNGAGKSTLFNLLTNLYRSDAGTVTFFGTPLAGKNSDAIARLGLVRTFQTARAFPGMTVLENVLAGMHMSARSPMWAHAFALASAGREERTMTHRAVALLDAIGLAGMRDRDATALPLGSQKLVELARAVISRPRMLLLDEPAAGLNDAETAQLARLLVAIHDSGTTVFVVEHNMSLVMGIADRVLVLDAGKLIANGTPAEIQADDAVIEAYVGRAAPVTP